MSLAGAVITLGMFSVSLFLTYRAESASVPEKT